MDIDDLINHPEGETPCDPVNEQYKNRLAVIISCGQSQRYLGKLVTIALRTKRNDFPVGVTPLSSSIYMYIYIYIYIYTHI